MPLSSMGIPQQWLITGGCGFIGRNLIKGLLGDSASPYIRIVDNLSVGTREDLKQVCCFKEVNVNALGDGPPISSRVDLIPGDIRDESLALKVSRHMDIIVHLAANTGVKPSVQHPRADFLNNCIGTFNYLEAARQNKIKRFVFASSGAPVGEHDPPIHEELAPHPVSPYGASKLAGEGYCSAYFRTFRLETVALRFGNVYGPLSNRKSSVIAKFIQRALGGEVLEIYGDGKQTRDFIFIDDLIEAILLSSIMPDIGGEIFQIASNAETTVSNLTKLLVKILGEYSITNVETAYIEPRLGDVKRNFSDTSKAADILKWHCKTELKSGLRKTVEWFMNQA